MHGLSMLLPQLQLPCLMAAVLVDLQQLPPQLLLDNNLSAWPQQTSETATHMGHSLGAASALGC